MKKLKLIGGVFTLISFLYIGYTIYKIDFDLSAININALSVTFSLISSILLAFIIFLFGLGWAWVLQLLSEKKDIDSKNFILIYCKTNIGKYLPGNVMHFAARNFIVNKLGWNHSKILLSSIIEVFNNLIIVSILVFSFKYKEITELIVYGNQFAKWFHYAFILAAFSGGILLIIYLRRKVGLKIDKKYFLLFGKHFILYSIIFAISGFILAVVLRAYFNEVLVIGDYINIILFYALSWLAGYLIVGSPGGIGIREAVLIILLSSSFEKETIVAAAMLHRIIYIAGESIAFGIATFIQKTNKPRFLDHLNK